MSTNHFAPFKIVIVIAAMFFYLTGSGQDVDNSEKISDTLRYTRGLLSRQLDYQNKLVNSLKESNESAKRAVLLELKEHLQELKRQMNRDSFQTFQETYYPTLLTEHKNISNSNDLVLKRKEQVYVIHHKRIDNYNHQFYLRNTDASKEGWFLDSDLVSAGGLSFVQEKKHALNKLYDDLEVTIAVALDKIRSDSVKNIEARYANLKIYKNKEYLESTAKLQKIEDDISRLELALENENQKAKLRHLQRKFGNKIGLRIYNEEMWIGMTESMLYESWGEPSKVNKTVLPNLVKKQLIYRNYYVYTENGYVTSYQSSY